MNKNRINRNIIKVKLDTKTRELLETVSHVNKVEISEIIKFCVDKYIESLIEKE